ncbi:hypothetical protein GPJ56_005211 [Histomonas meleagridis]|uniref:uncharacterized protein n=1 Tax=Histomonas meleagridis TaxID=135588 RepID=UPI00355981DD|nr:hypothetical protein GPJ56_005211 [Histomonas meleagridis]KAH0802061.1 hypothetical protein GO595_005142 [Histomonas meleagridis]
MGNDISVVNSISYYKKILEEKNTEKIPSFKLDKINFLENHDIEDCSLFFIFSLDTDHDGFISNSDIETFIQSVHKAGLDPNDCDFRYKCGSYFSEQICAYLITNGKEKFKEWFRKCIETSFQIVKEEEIIYIDGDAVKRIYDILEIHQLLGCNFQWILDMFQRHAEANFQMNLNNPELDDFVPVDTILCFVEQIIDGAIESYSMLSHR